MDSSFVVPPLSSQVSLGWLCDAISAIIPFRNGITVADNVSVRPRGSAIVTKAQIMLLYNLAASAKWTRF